MGAEVMGEMLRTEADYRVLLVTLNALHTPLSSESKLQDRNSLYPSFGNLYPEGTKELRKAWNETTVRTALEPYAKYWACTTKSNSSMIKNRLLPGLASNPSKTSSTKKMCGCSSTHSSNSTISVSSMRGLSSESRRYATSDGFQT